MNYLARNPTAATDPLIQRFDETRFELQNTSANEAVGFAENSFN
jgi:hypothetical protein